MLFIVTIEESNESLIYTRQYFNKTTTSQELITVDSNSNEYLVFYVEEGQGTVFYNGEFIGIKQYDLLFLDLNNDFYYSSDFLKSISFIIGGIVAHKVRTDNFVFSMKNKNSFKNIQTVFENEKRNNQIQILQGFLDIINELNKIDNVYTIKKNENEMNIAIRYIEANFKKRLDVESIASKINFSKYYFIRKFKEYVNVTPYQYIIYLRLEHSKYLLQYTTKRICEIAIESGFASEVNYITCFKNKNKITPTTYRKIKEN